MSQKSEIHAYLSRIGQAGGRKSRRHLSSEDARNMVRLREARRAFRMFHAQCFWHMPEDLPISQSDIPEIIRGLRTHGGRRGYLAAERLCP